MLSEIFQSQGLSIPFSMGELTSSQGVVAVGGDSPVLLYWMGGETSVEVFCVPIPEDVGCFTSSLTEAQKATLGQLVGDLGSACVGPVESRALVMAAVETAAGIRALTQNPPEVVAADVLDRWLDRWM